MMPATNEITQVPVAGDQFDRHRINFEIIDGRLAGGMLLAIPDKPNA
jgi:hypothetical protein